MASYPPKIVLPYRVGRAWLEERMLAGEVGAPIEAGEIVTDELTPQLRERASRLVKRIDDNRFDWKTTKTVEVVGSGIHPWDRGIHESGRELTPSDAVTEMIGILPELRRPTDSATKLIEAYEAWVEQYLDMSLDALAGWIDQWAVEGEPDEEGNAPNGAPIAWWTGSVTYSLEGEEHLLKIDGRTDLELFQRVVGASQLRSHAENTTGEDVMNVALDVVGGSLELAAEPSGSEEVVAAHVDYIERLANVAFARHWTRQREREDFDQEMRRWAAAHGSTRLQMGISDQYRMIPVYLQERTGAEVPRFYAHPAMKDKRHAWRLRTGPSQEALQLRRAVQERLERHARPGASVLTAEIGWMKKPPAAMCDERHLHRTDEWASHDDEMRECAFEIIGVRNWLGRYTLIAGVYSEADPLPDFLLLKYVLKPQDYDLEDLLQPPGGDSLAENQVNRSLGRR